jgi:hypothetical protein
MIRFDPGSEPLITLTGFKAGWCDFGRDRGAIF